MLYREAGQFKTSYAGRSGGLPDPAGPDRHRRHPRSRLRRRAADRVETSSSTSILIPFLIFALATIGLNILTGYTGLLSLGTGGFMGVGAYACYKLTTIFPGVNIIAPDPRVGLLRGRGRRRVRPAVAAHQGLLSRGRDARRAVLPVVVLHPHALALQLQRLGRDRGADAHAVRRADHRPERDADDALSRRARHRRR